MTVRTFLNWVGAAAVAASLAAGRAAPAVDRTFHPGPAPRAEFKVGGESYKIDPRASSARQVRSLPPDRFDPVSRRDRVDHFYRDTLKDRFRDRHRGERWRCERYRPEFIYWVGCWRPEWRARWAWCHRAYLDDLLWADWMSDAAFAAQIAALQQANAAVHLNSAGASNSAVRHSVIDGS